MPLSRFLPDKTWTKVVMILPKFKILKIKNKQEQEIETTMKL